MWPRWLRTISTIWVAWDSKKRKSTDVFWAIVTFILGPLMIPFYMASRPLLKGEKRINNYLWDVFFNFQRFFSWIMALAAAGVFMENMTRKTDKDIAEVKNAEIKAGTVLGIFVFILLLIIERVGFDSLKSAIQQKYLDKQ
jgi:hypothetical protein